MGLTWHPYPLLAERSLCVGRWPNHQATITVRICNTSCPNSQEKGNFLLSFVLILSSAHLFSSYLATSLIMTPALDILHYLHNTFYTTTVLYDILWCGCLYNDHTVLLVSEDLFLTIISSSGK